MKILHTPRSSIKLLIIGGSGSEKNNCIHKLIRTHYLLKPTYMLSVCANRAVFSRFLQSLRFCWRLTNFCLNGHDFYFPPLPKSVQ